MFCPCLLTPPRSVACKAAPAPNTSEDSSSEQETRERLINKVPRGLEGVLGRVPFVQCPVFMLFFLKCWVRFLVEKGKALLRNKEPIQNSAARGSDDDDDRSSVLFRLITGEPGNIM